jgi:hypothetical protein
MRRAAFTAGLFPHQARVAVWVRRRLIDYGGGLFDTGRRTRPIDQYGVVAADGVGLGKTWEALAASALILVERGKERRGGGRRQTVRRRPARVLVLCPPGLVSKWSREVRDPDGFSRRLGDWAKGGRRQFVLKTLTDPYEIRRRSDLPPASLHRAALRMPPGTYVCNWNVLRKRVKPGRSRLGALREQPWDVVIVDEAHHREAREAIDAVWESASRILLLTATPFQLEPRQLHDLFRDILDTQHAEHKVLARPPVKPFVDGLSRFFEGAEPPSRRVKREAERVLQQLVARSEVPAHGRRYFVVDAEGDAERIPPPDQLREDALHGLLPKLVASSSRFESWYLRQRLCMADGPRTFVPTKLRQALSTPRQIRASGLAKAPGSPRLEALTEWAMHQVEADLMTTLRDGYPRKTLVFTSFVSEAAEEIREALADALDTAWKSVRGSAAWMRMAREATEGAKRVRRQLERFIKGHEALSHSDEARLLMDSLSIIEHATAEESGLLRDLFGHRRFRRLLIVDLRRRLSALSRVLQGDKGSGWWDRLHREERRSVRAVIMALGRSNAVGTYTGNDDRRERDAAGEAFRSPLFPWILVASNVGSEGIDLHTFSAHLVHFDIEWNPARMEQREGRSDRLGRELKEPVNVYFVLVRGTYDERMLYQFVARQRWHGVLLGRAGARLARDKKGLVDARWVDSAEAHKLRLDLRP